MAGETKTEGIVLNGVKYGEGCVIVNVLTESRGRRSYMVKSTGKKRKEMMPLLMPLSIVEIDGEESRHGTIDRVKEVHIKHPLASLPFDPMKRSIGIFMMELVMRSVKDEMADGNVYEYVRNSVMALDEGMEGIYNFHLYFMWRLTRLLGFEPDVSGWDVVMRGGFFDLMNGEYVETPPSHRHILQGEEAKLWARVGEMELGRLEEVKMTLEERRRAIGMMEEFYALHIPGFGGLKSVEVLGELDIR